MLWLQSVSNYACHSHVKFLSPSLLPLPICIKFSFWLTCVSCKRLWPSPTCHHCLGGGGDAISTFLITSAYLHRPCVVIDVCLLRVQAKNVAKSHVSPSLMRAPGTPAAGKPFQLHMRCRSSCITPQRNTAESHYCCCTALQCAVLCCAAMCCALLRCNVLCCAVLCCAVLSCPECMQCWLVMVVTGIAEALQDYVMFTDLHHSSTILQLIAAVKVHSPYYVTIMMLLCCSIIYLLIY